MLRITIIKITDLASWHPAWGESNSEQNIQDCWDCLYSRRVCYRKEKNVGRFNISRFVWSYVYKDGDEHLKFYWMRCVKEKCMNVWPELSYVQGND